MTFEQSGTPLYVHRLHPPGARSTDDGTQPPEPPLLAAMIEAHGGEGVWSGKSSIIGKVKIEGEIWNENDGQVPFSNARFEILTKEAAVTLTPTVTGAAVSSFRPNVVTLSMPDGGFVETQYNPRSSFARGKDTRSWDDFEAAYICSYSAWTCLTQPFLFSYSGFQTEEIGPILVSGEIWRRLVVTFPGHVASHSEHMICHIGPDGLLRRQDFHFDVMDRVSVMSFPSNYQEIAGIKVPTVRRMYRASDIIEGMERPVLAAIEFSDLDYVEHESSNRAAKCA